ncbi:hypothetical protein [Inquilinus sp.]|jgi:hypothetical protein|uniref:hypothetical protein n=1 Tax=Inquilinus sp. TaxID=1932117 RepID=UPI0037848CA2
MTVREIDAFAAGVRRRDEMEWRRALFGAWHAAQFARAKKIPGLDKLMRRIGKLKPAPRKTPEQLLRIAEMLNAAFGGADHRKKTEG